MGIGHIAVGLALKRAEPRLNLGVLVFAAFLSDFLLGWFALAGLESYTVPADVATRHYLLFSFPYSHSLAATFGWAALLGLLISQRAGRTSQADQRKIAIVVALAVVSHFLLDAMVHVAGLPLLGENSPKVGLGLWRDLPAEASLEVLMTVVGLWLYWGTASDLRPKVKVTLVVLTGLLAAAMIAGQMTMTEAPPRESMIAGWIAMPVILAVLFGLLDGRRLKPAD